MEKEFYVKAENFLSIIREMIKHENELVNHRLCWLFTLQGLLYAASSFLWDTSILPIAVFAFVGIVSCISIGYIMKRGLDAIKSLLETALNYKITYSINDEFPPIIGTKTKAIEWILPGNLLPWVMGIAWLAIIAARITDTFG